MKSNLALLAATAPFAALAVNPVLPLWEHVPDVEPRVFDGRLYLFGSHDLANGWDFCLDDYVGWSAPLTDLTDWRCEGVIFKKTDDPENKDGKAPLYAPDVVKGPDGRYYLFYERADLKVDGKTHLGVAVCDQPAGKYEFLGYLRRPDGSLVGDRPGENLFDPAVLVDGEDIWLYTGFAFSGASVWKLRPDMLTVEEGPTRIVPGLQQADGTAFNGHGFFEASSIRKIDGRYVFVYSDQTYSNLAYATAERPTGPFTYKGVLVRNAGGNNHGGLVELNGAWHIFWHRHTNGTSFSRQCCAERLERTPDGEFKTAEITSQGLGGKPLPGKGCYPAAIACDYAGGARVMQIGAGETAEVFVGELWRGAQIGFKYFDFSGVKRVTVETRGWAAGTVEVRTEPDGPVRGVIPTAHTFVWEKFSGEVQIPDGVRTLYLTFNCSCTCGAPQIRSVELE